MKNEFINFSIGVVAGVIITAWLINPVLIDHDRIKKELATVKSNTWELKTQIWRLENGKELEGIDLIPKVINIKRSLKKKTKGTI